MQDPLLIDIDEDSPELYTGDISTCGEVGSNSSSSGDDRPLQMRLNARDKVAVRLVVAKEADKLKRPVTLVLTPVHSTYLVVAQTFTYILWLRKHFLYSKIFIPPAQALLI